MYYSSVLPEEVKQDHFQAVRSAQALLHHLLDCVLTDCVVQLVVDRVITSVVVLLSMAQFLCPVVLKENLQPLIYAWYIE